VLVSNVSSLVTGNPNLKPEIANTLTYGAVYSPSWAPSLQVSVDYYDITINGAISTVSDQVGLDQCFAGVTSFCSLNTRDANGNLTQFRSSPINYSRLRTTGIDIEASYRVPVGDWIKSWNGQLTLRGVANRVNKYVTSAPGLVTRDIAGSIIDSQPKWRAQGIIDYANGGFDITFMARYVGGGIYDVSRSPEQLGFRHVDSQTFFDGQISFDIPQVKNGQFYLNVRNLSDTAPRIAPSPGNLVMVTNPTLYDTVGRMFRVGVKLGF